MKEKRFIRHMLAVMLSIAICTGLVFADSAVTFAAEKTVTGSFEDGVSGETFSIDAVYDDAFFAGDSKKEQRELSKLSMLAAATAYDKTSAAKLLKKCGFKGKYTENTVTKDDNDYVSYAIGHKKTDDCTVVAVWVRGTGGNYEWISNFNLGDGNTHKGFSTAEKRLFKDVKKYMKKNKITSDVKFWVTGHSRGAAVGNLLAKRLTDKYGTGNVFAYTFATPAVSTLASAKCEKKYKNIYNYINTGDFVTAVPPQEWGYYRYGHDIYFAASDDDAVKSAFYDMTSVEYGGFSEAEKQELVNAFLDYCGEDVSAYYTARENGITPAEFCMNGLGGSLSGDKGAYLYLLGTTATDEQASKIVELVVMGDDSSAKFAHAHCLPAYFAGLAGR